jgi:hypothetical protein
MLRFVGCINWPDNFDVSENFLIMSINDEEIASDQYQSISELLGVRIPQWSHADNENDQVLESGANHDEEMCSVVSTTSPNGSMASLSPMAVGRCDSAPITSHRPSPLNIRALLNPVDTGNIIGNTFSYI